MVSTFNMPTSDQSENWTYAWRGILKSNLQKLYSSKLYISPVDNSKLALTRDKCSSFGQKESLHLRFTMLL